MKKARFFPSLLICLLTLISTASVCAQSESVTAEMRKQANDFFQHGDWTSAAQAYEAIIKLEPQNAGAWARRALALHSLGRHTEAVVAYERSLEINSQQPLTLFNLARTLALLGDKGKAFNALTKALEVGYSQPLALETENDLRGLRDDPRFKRLVTQAATNAKPCAARTEYRQLDFWIGDWDVRGRAQGQAAGTSSIQLILGDCVIFENWTATSGTNGKSFSFFNSETGKWRQTWVDDKGGLLEFFGDYHEGAMRFIATTMNKGQKVLQRMTLFNLSPKEMRQLGEQSTDEGKTWSVMYDLIYNRRK
jgi:tetratricopeptide (TPR) repeat protein